GDAVGTNFRSWAPPATHTAIQGSHGTGILNTVTNDIAAEQYLKFKDEGVKMRVSSVLAKESISPSIKKKKARLGPLFFMKKM
ncbi:MAG: recombinase, partial [Rhodobacteraceae bacterium]|nr:recombinase [Paracoccaceae bacterium]